MRATPITGGPPRRRATGPNEGFLKRSARQPRITAKSVRGVWFARFMFRPQYCLMLALAGGAVLPLLADDEPAVFRSEVSLVRVDVQLLDRDNRAITGL